MNQVLDRLAVTRGNKVYAIFETTAMDQVFILLHGDHCRDAHVRIFGEVMKHLNAEQQRWLMRIILKGKFERLKYAPCSVF